MSFPIDGPRGNSPSLGHVDFWQRVQTSASDNLRALIGETHWREVEALAREEDPELFLEGAYHLARRLEEAHPEGSARIYSAILNEGNFPRLQGRAQARLDALRGHGPIGARVEVLMNHFVQEASDPATLLAMATAGTVFRVAQLSCLSRLAAAPASALTRGFAARGLAGIAGFALEAPAFTFASKLGHQALGRPQDWRMAPLAHELASSYLVLGALKFSGLSSGALHRRFLGESNSFGQALSRGLFQQAGMLGGILLGHRAEEAVGLRARQERGAMLVDSLALLMQFNVAGRINRQVLGENFHRWEHSLDLQSQALSSPRTPRWPNLSVEPAWAMAGAAEPIRFPGFKSGSHDHLLMMSGNLPDGKTEAPAEASWSMGFDSMFPEPLEVGGKAAWEEGSDILAEPTRRIEELADVLDWSDSQDRRSMLRQAIDRSSLDSVLNRIAELSASGGNRESFHAIRLFHSLYLETWNSSSKPLNHALDPIAARLPVEAERVHQWSEAKKNLIDAYRAEGAEGSRFGEELEAFSRLSFPSSVVERTLYLSRESQQESGRKAYAFSGFLYAELGSRLRRASDPLDRYMTAFQLAKNLAETGHVVRARSTLFRALDHSDSADGSALPEGMNQALRSLLDSHMNGLDLALGTVASVGTSDPASFAPLFERRVRYSSVRPLGLVQSLRENAVDAAQGGNPTRSQRHLRLAHSLFESALIDPKLRILDPQLSDPALTALRQRFLEIAALPPGESREEWNAPVNELVEALLKRGEYGAALHTLSDFHQVDLGNPMAFRNIALSLTAAIEIAHPRGLTPEAQTVLRQLADFERRIQ